MGLGAGGGRLTCSPTLSDLQLAPGASRSSLPTEQTGVGLNEVIHEMHPEQQFLTDATPRNNHQPDTKPSTCHTRPPVISPRPSYPRPEEEIPGPPPSQRDWGGSRAACPPLHKSTSGAEGTQRPGNLPPPPGRSKRRARTQSRGPKPELRSHPVAAQRALLGVGASD